jgi:hypothetical protein
MPSDMQYIDSVSVSAPPKDGTAAPRPPIERFLRGGARVALDVPRDAVGISFGVLLDGPGQLWLDDVALEPVGRDTPLTGRSFVGGWQKP